MLFDPPYSTNCPMIRLTCMVRVMELVRVHLKDLDFAYHQITVRAGKKTKDRSVPIPKTLIASLKKQVLVVNTVLEPNVVAGYGSVFMPEALARKYPIADYKLRQILI